MDSKSLSLPLYSSSSSAKTEFDDTRSLPSLFKNEGMLGSKSLSFRMQLSQLFVCIASIMILGCIGLAIQNLAFNWLSFRRSGRPPRKPPHKTTMHERLLVNREQFGLWSLQLHWFHLQFDQFDMETTFALSKTLNWFQWKHKNHTFLLRKQQHIYLVQCSI
jgi:hypothetical protein